MGLVLQKDKEPSWVRYIKQRIRKNKNFLCFISGQTGSGKSYSSLRIAEMVDPNFNIERVVFSGTELMKLINSGTLKKGSAIVFEEAGIGLSNRNWQSTTNKMLNFLVQTFRHRNFILIFNSPYLDFVDAATRRLFHAEFRTMSIDFKEKKCKLKPQHIQYNSRLKKFYYKYLKVITPEGTIPVKRWNVSKPSKELLQDYEEKKTEFTDRLNAEIMKELEDANSNTKELTEKQKEVLDVLEDGNTMSNAAKILGKDVSSISRTVKYIEKKGYKVNPKRENGIVVGYNVTEP